MTQKSPKFLTGDLMRHITVMSVSASVGLVSIFLVDFVDLYFISLLGQKELAAAVGFAGTLIFFNLSITIGLMIAMSALAARRIGAGDEAGARDIATSVMTVGVIFGTVFGAVFWLAAPQLLDLIGAEGETKSLATRYLRIIVPTLPISAVGMIASGLLRAHGDARRAMNATLSAGFVNAVLDPMLIFGLGLGLDGAALASVAARIAMMAAALRPVFRYYGGFAPFHVDHLLRDLRPIFAIAIPAVMTNIATPVGNIIVTRTIAPFGDGAVAGYAVAGRLMPLAFCVLFALSGAVGPIIGQNFGARNYDRVRGTAANAIKFIAGYTLVAWGVLFALNGWIAGAFSLDGDGAAVIFWFCAAVAPLFFFNGLIFFANASFNNLNRPLWSTFLNWGRHTLGVIPFVIVGADLGGAPGVLVGQAAGGVIFGLIGFYLVRRLIDGYESGRIDPEKGWKIKLMRERATAPFSSNRG